MPLKSFNIISSDTCFVIARMGTRRSARKYVSSHPGTHIEPSLKRLKSHRMPKNKYIVNSLNYMLEQFGEEYI